MDLHTHGPGERGGPMSWLLVAVIAVAFVAGGFAVIEESWPLFWVCLAVLVLSVPATRLKASHFKAGHLRVSRLKSVLGNVKLVRDPSALPSVDLASAPAVTAEQPVSS